MRVPRAFTLPEMLVTLVVLSILAALAAPGFRHLRQEWQLRTATSAVLASLARARLSALTSGRETRLCPTRDGLRCNPEGGPGLLLLTGAPAPGALPFAVTRLSSAVTVSANRPAVTYYPWPRAASPVTLTLCSPQTGAQGRHIIVSQTGRPRVERVSAC